MIHALALSTDCHTAVFAVDKSRWDFIFFTEMPSKKSNPGLLGAKREFYPLRYAAPCITTFTEDVRIGQSITQKQKGPY